MFWVILVKFDCLFAAEFVTKIFILMCIFCPKAMWKYCCWLLHKLCPVSAFAWCWIFYVVFNKLYYVSCWVFTIESQDSLLEIFCEVDFEEVNYIRLKICWRTKIVWSCINLCIILNGIIWKLDSAASSVNQQNCVQSSEWNDTIDYCLHLFYLYLYKYIFNVIEVTVPACSTKNLMEV